MLKNVIALALIALSATAYASGKRGPTPDWSHVEKRLSDAGFQKAFIRDLKKNYDRSKFDQVLELNTILYLKKANDDIHAKQVSAKVDVEAEVLAFMKQQKKALKEAEKLYGVSPSHISGLLWLETRHGKNQGKFHVPSVYVHLMQADRPSVMEYLKKAAGKHTKVDGSIEHEIEERAERKAKWAMGELKAIAEMWKAKKTVIVGWRGSFAGAFGMAQFIPSSFVAYAKPHKKGRVPDLRRADDAIMSVAHYLHKNGWKKRKPETYETALYRYNKSGDYVQAIMSISRRADRAPAAKN
ncbi:MAG: lytic murein transglycosylase [Bdellovibrionia bacterium]